MYRIWDLSCFYEEIAEKMPQHEISLARERLKEMLDEET
jgi:hypothetical protein